MRLNWKRRVLGEHRAQSSEKGVGARDGESRRKDRLNERRLAGNVLRDPPGVPVRETTGTTAERTGRGGGGQGGRGGEFERREWRRGEGESEVSVGRGDGVRRDAVCSHIGYEFLRVSDAVSCLRTWCERGRGVGGGSIDGPTSQCSWERSPGPCCTSLRTLAVLCDGRRRQGSW
mgnify:FL=1